MYLCSPAFAAMSILQPWKADVERLRQYPVHRSIFRVSCQGRQLATGETRNQTSNDLNESYGVHWWNSQMAGCLVPFRHQACGLLIGRNR